MKRLAFILLLLFPSIVFASRNFDGANDEIDMGNNHDVTTVDLTFGVWYRGTEDAGTDLLIGKKNGITATNAGWTLWQNATDNNAVIMSDGTDSVTCTGTNDTDGGWHLTIVTWNASTEVVTQYLREFIGNSLVTESTDCTATGGGSIDSLTNAVVLQMGETSADAEDATGQMAFAFVYRGQLLSTAERAEIAFKPGFIPPTTKANYGFWPIWGVNAPEVDQSGNALTGAVTGTTLSREMPPAMFGGGLPL